MKSVPTLRQEQAVDRIARQITARLSEGEALLPYEVTERLRASREQAVSIRRREAAVQRVQTSTAASAQGNTLTLGSPDEGNGWWRTLVSAIPVFALIAGLVIYNSDTEQSMLSEVTEVDTALLTDDLPPAAYSDPGFIQYLKTSAATPSEH